MAKRVFIVCQISSTRRTLSPCTIPSTRRNKGHKRRRPELTASGLTSSCASRVTHGEVLDGAQVAAYFAVCQVPRHTAKDSQFAVCLAAAHGELLSLCYVPWAWHPAKWPETTCFFCFFTFKVPTQTIYHWAYITTNTCNIYIYKDKPQIHKSTHKLSSQVYKSTNPYWKSS